MSQSHLPSLRANTEFKIDIDGEMQQSYLDYAMSVIVARALPDVRDGLKPGESTTLESSVFMRHEGMDGPHDFAVHLKTNGPNTPDLVVHVLSNWIP